MNGRQKSNTHDGLDFLPRQTESRISRSITPVSKKLSIYIGTSLTARLPLSEKMKQLMEAVENAPMEQQLILVNEKDQWLWRKSNIFSRENKIKQTTEQIISVIWDGLLAGQVYITLKKDTFHCITIGKMLFERTIFRNFLLENVSLFNRWLKCIIEDKFGKIRRSINQKLALLHTIDSDLTVLLLFLQKKQQIIVSAIREKYHLENNTLCNLCLTDIHVIIRLLDYQDHYAYIADHEAFVVTLRNIIFNPQDVLGHNTVTMESFSKFFIWAQVYYQAYENFINALSLAHPQNKYAIVEYFIEKRCNLQELRKESEYKNTTPESLIYISEDERKQAQDLWIQHKYEQAMSLCADRYKKLISVSDRGFEVMLEQLIDKVKRRLGISIPEYEIDTNVLTIKRNRNVDEYAGIIKTLAARVSSCCE